MTKGKNNIGFVLLIIFIIVVLIIGIVALIINKMIAPHGRLEGPGEELGFDIFVGDEKMPVKTSKDEGRDLVEELKAINVTYKDCVAWLKVPGTTIDYPIFQATNNTKYYRNDRDLKETNWGENYLDYRCDVSNLNNPFTNIIIYGHNTETDNRFTPLLNYKSQEFFAKHKKIELATAEGTNTYEVFAVYSTDTSFYYIDTVFQDEADFNLYLDSCLKKTRYSTGVKVSEKDSILTLSTCDYSLKKGRFVVQARLVK